MTGRELYEAYEAAGPLLKPWEHLSNEDRNRWEAVRKAAQDED